MKKNNGFTLMELLAVIIILGVIALIATPIILNVINDAKEGANKDTAYGLIHAAEVYHGQSLLDEKKRYNIEYLNDIYAVVPIKGTKPAGGKLYANEMGYVALSVIMDKKCYMKTFKGELEINNSDCNLGIISKDDIKPVVAFKVNGTKGSNDWYTSDTSVEITVEDYESGPFGVKWCTGSDCIPEKQESIIKKSVKLSNKEDNIVCAIGLDTYGNESEKVCTDKIKVDTKAPVLTSKTEDVTIKQYDKVEALSYFAEPVYSISGSASISCNPTSTTDLNLGKRTVVCKATGNNGLVTTTKKVINVTPGVTVFPFKYTGKIEEFKAFRKGTYKLETWGASGGDVGSIKGFNGAYAVSYVNLSEGDILKVLTGGAGGMGAGGGGSFVTTSTNAPLSIAGGGGGSGGPQIYNDVTNTPNINNYGQKTERGGITTTTGGVGAGHGGNSGIDDGPAGGGGGLLSNGKSGEAAGGIAFVNGGLGSPGVGTAFNASTPGNGGFGGGAGAYNNNANGFFRGGGGGGYSGGQGGTYMPTTMKNAGGAGGGSYFTGRSSFARAGNENMPTHDGTGTMVGNKGNGYAKITYIPDTDYDYTGSTQTFTASADGTYKLEVWGAQGGTKYNYLGGKGGYATGVVTLKKGTNLYINVGGQGIIPTSSSTSLTPGGFNGGGKSAGSESTFRGSGGGATDIRIGDNSLYSRVIVAGGGGGAWNTGSFSNNVNLAFGGGLTGGNSAGHGTATSGGTQIAGGGNDSNVKGTFGTGGGANSTSTYTGGGGGWYGGAGNSGGSGWIFTADSFATWKAGNATDASKYLLTNQYYLTNSKMISGNASMPKLNETSNMTGNAGHGYARVYLIEQ